MYSHSDELQLRIRIAHTGWSGLLENGGDTRHSLVVRSELAVAVGANCPQGSGLSTSLVRIAVVRCVRKPSCFGDQPTHPRVKLGPLGPDF